KILEDEKFKEGKNFYLGFVPERVNPGDKVFKIDNTPAVVSGVSKKSLELIKEIYLNITNKVFPVSSPRVAEMTKLLENIFRNINIALVNEIALLCERMKIDIWEVISAASTKPFGFMPFYPGPGVGGHCIPIDPYYLSYKAWEYDMPLEFINLAARINESMPYHTANRVLEVLNEKGILPRNAKILIFGVAFKKDVSDIRHSPALKVIEILYDKVKKISYIDPYIPEINIKGKNLKSLRMSSGNIKKYDISVILTDHSVFNQDLILKNSKLIFDARNLFKNIKSEKIYKLGA
ncbi:MAG: nucleotide sugar dehydrogenase, partial [candidate division WOR-3 bacterium]